jgi:hypothetical protein
MIKKAEFFCKSELVGTQVSKNTTSFVDFLQELLPKNSF